MWKVIIFLVLAVITLILVTSYTLQEPQLMPKATKLTEISRTLWIGQEPSFNYYWLSDDVLLFFANNDLHHPYTFDLKTKAKAPFPSKQLNQLIDSQISKSSQIRIYPSGPTPAYRFPGRLPVGYLEFYYTISRQGDRIAWELVQNSSSPVRTFFHRLLPSYIAPSKRMISVWVSNMDGSKMHEIGTVKEPHPEYSDIALEPYHLYWMPDGKHLSFVYKDALWKVSAD